MSDGIISQIDETQQRLEHAHAENRAAAASLAPTTTTAVGTALSGKEKVKMDGTMLKLIAKIVDERLTDEFRARDDIIVEMKKHLDILREQMSVQSEKWAQMQVPMPGQKGSPSKKPLPKMVAAPRDPLAVENAKGIKHAVDAPKFDSNLPRVAGLQLKKVRTQTESDMQRHSAHAATIRYAKAKSAVYKPTEAETTEYPTSAPKTELQLNYVQGYNGEQGTTNNVRHGSTKNTNILWLPNGNMVYPAATLCVVHDPVANTQLFFDSHTDNVMAIAVHPGSADPSKDSEFIVASGQDAWMHNANVCLWDAKSVPPRHIRELDLGPGSKGVRTLDFAPDGDLLCCTCCDPSNSMSIWNWRKGILIISHKCSNAEVFAMRWNPFLYVGVPEDTGGVRAADYSFVSVGVRHAKFWNMEFNDDGGHGSSRGGGLVEGHEAKGYDPNDLVARRMDRALLPDLWHIEGNAVSLDGKAEKQDITCVCFVIDSDGEPGLGIPPSGRIFTGTEDGSMLVWAQLEEALDDGLVMGGEEGQEDKPPRIRWQARARILCRFKCHDDRITDCSHSGRASNKIATCGNDSKIAVWQVVTGKNKKVEPLRLIASVNLKDQRLSFTLGTPRSLKYDFAGDQLVCGTTGNSVVVMREEAMGKSLSTRLLMEAHTGAVLCAATHPSQDIYATSGSDRTVRLFSSYHRRQLGMYRLTGTGTEGTAMTFHPHGHGELAVGTDDGEIVILRFRLDEDTSAAKDWKQVARKAVSKNVTAMKAEYTEPPKNRLKVAEEDLKYEDEVDFAAMTSKPKGASVGVMGKRPDSDSKFDAAAFDNIVDLKYSPNGEVLAAAAQDSKIYLFGMTQGMKRMGICKGHSAAITHIDFSNDGAVLQSNCLAKEILFWNVKDEPEKNFVPGKQISSAFSLRDVEWQTWTSLLGWPVMGIWIDVPEKEAIEITSLDRSHDGMTIVLTGPSTDTRPASVRLMRYPCVPIDVDGDGKISVAEKRGGCQYRQVYGHRHHPTAARFAHDDKRVVTTGGKDGCVMTWNHIPYVPDVDGQQGPAGADIGPGQEMPNYFTS